MGLNVLQFDIVRIKSQKRANMIVNVAGLLMLDEKIADVLE